MKDKIFIIIIILFLLPLSSYAHERFIKLPANAAYEVENTYIYEGYKVIQVTLPSLSHYSYLLVDGKNAVVVDPGRDIFIYLKLAQKEKAKIRAIFLTHSHADFVAGHIELAKTLNIPIHISKKAKALYPHKSMNDGEKVKIGKLVTQFVATPGHTPDSMCIYVYGKANYKEPEIVFTGDTLFVGSVGRPDLLEGKMSAATLASQMFDSWTQKLALLPDKTVIFPAHGAGSLCGSHLSDKSFSTIGEQRKNNRNLQHDSRSAFIAAILGELPSTPQYFKHNALLNRKGPEKVRWNDSIQREKLSRKLMNFKKYFLVDIRKAEEYAKGHIPYSINIALRGKFETWVGIMVPWNSNLILCGNEKDMFEATLRLHRIGYKAKVVYFNEWKKAGFPLKKTKTYSPKAFYSLMQRKRAPMLLDVRKLNEWKQAHVPLTLNLPINTFHSSLAKLDIRQPIATICRSGYRASMAIGFLERYGFKTVGTISGGGKAWKKRGLAMKGTAALTSSSCGTLPSKKSSKNDSFRLPERISADTLNRFIMDLPGSYEVLDIRPSHYYNDYHIPHSKNITIEELLKSNKHLQGDSTLIIVCRDGSMAMMVAGILSQKTNRPIKALYGGVQAYWKETKLKSFMNSKGSKRKKNPHVPKTKKKKRSAGC